MRFVIDVVDYDPHMGVSHEWIRRSKVECKMEDNTVTINANRQGMESLANALLSLSQPSVPTGSHIHMDDLNGLERGSCELIFVKQEPQ